MFTNDEYVDMLLILGECHRNRNAAALLYQQRYPNRRHPSIQVFNRLEHRLREHGNVLPLEIPGRGRPRVRNPEMEEEILEAVEEDPTRSTRSIGQELGVSNVMVHRVIKEERYHPYHYTKVQALLPNDFALRTRYCNWLLAQAENDATFLQRILWTDEANFSRDGYFNSRNSHYYSMENPHVFHQHHHQHRFSVNVWAGIIGNHVLGPFIIPNRLNGDNFLHFLRNEVQDSLMELPLAVVRQMWFQLDGAPAHFAAPVRAWLDEEFPNRWIGRNGPVLWPPRSPDLTPLDFFFWGHIKAVVYRTPVENEQDLRNRIQNAAQMISVEMLQRIRGNILKRAQSCIMAQGENFEQLF